MKPLLAILLFLISSAAVADITGSAYVIDGDTIDISDVRIRLNGIDTPEIEQTCRTNGLIWHCGVEATKVMRHLTKGKTVTCIGNTKDQYGRLIANCFIGNLNLNATMVEAGMALAYRYYSLEYVEQEDFARETKQGLWSGEFIAPWDWRKGERLPKESDVNKACCKICQKGKACGDSCIKRSYTCTKAPGCACDANP